MLTLNKITSFNDIIIDDLGVLPILNYNSDPTDLYPFCFNNFILENKPFLLKSCTKDWKSSTHWVINNKPNFNYLIENYGDIQIPVANCNSNYFNSHSKKNMALKKYMTQWNENIGSLKENLYLKDWHFTKDFKTDNVYRVPNVFASDWLNEYYTESLEHIDDYRFVYMGSKNTWTPLHADVFHSFSWSVNICGKKQWLLLAPGNEKYFLDSFNNLIFDMNTIDKAKLPHNIIFTVEQGAGDAIFIPSGWHHQVCNLDDTISVNHNWINGCNIINSWLSMNSHIEAVKHEIDDCKDMDNWESHCQLMLQVSYGMNFKQFYDMLNFIARKRLESLKNGTPIQVFGDWTLGTDHILFDLKKISECLKLCKQHEDWDSQDKSQQLIDDIQCVT